MNIWDEIQAERKRQDEKWGGALHDNDHHLVDWAFYIHKRTGIIGGVGKEKCDKVFKSHRQIMVEIAALAVAAIEAFDRTGRT